MGSAPGSAQGGGHTSAVPPPKLCRGRLAGAVCCQDDPPREVIWFDTGRKS